jgi:hypothetical protein
LQLASPSCSLLIFFGSCLLVSGPFCLVCLFHLHLARMSSTMLDSEPVFRERMTAIGISDAFQLALIAAGINALARLAFHRHLCLALVTTRHSLASWSMSSLSLLLLTLRQGNWLAFDGFGAKLTRSHCLTSGHGPKLRRILQQEDFQSRKELPDSLTTNSTCWSTH